MRVPMAFVVFFAASPVPAEDFSGTYGSATDPATSCAANPHRLEFMARPPHAFLTWDKPWTGPDGREVTHRRFDLEAMDDRMLTLEEEGGARLADGSRPVWFLRLTDSPKGYCWGRADWPSVRCENQQLLCAAAAS